MGHALAFLGVVAKACWRELKRLRAMKRLPLRSLNPDEGLRTIRSSAATLGRLEKSLDAAAALKGEQLEGELKAAVEELDVKKSAFALATNASPGDA